jgi:drug/metabolite transporter (DMT)-like permease
LNTLALFAGCVAIWGTTWLAITFQLGSVAPEVSVSYRFLLAALLVAAWCRLRGLPLRFRAAEHAALAFMGVAMYSIGYIFVYHAETHLPSGVVAVGASAYPLFTMLGMRLVFGQPMTARMAIGSALGITGVALVFWPEFDSVARGGSVALGAAFTMLSVLVSTIGSLAAQRNHERKLAGWPAMAVSMGYGGLASLAAALALGRSLAIEWSALYLLSLAYLAVFGSVLAFGAFLTLLGRIGAARASYVGVMVPIVALLISAVLEGYDWQVLTLAGVAVSVAGNVLVLRRAG